MTRWGELQYVIALEFKLIVSVCRSCQLAFVIKKHFLDLFAEEPRDLDCQWKARVIPTRFNRVDGLTSDTDRRRQLRLRPFPLGTQNAKSCFH